MTTIPQRNLAIVLRKLKAQLRLKSLGKIHIAEPAEPLFTHFTKTHNYMTKNIKSEIRRFRWFRWGPFLQSVWEKVPLVPLCSFAMAEKGAMQACTYGGGKPRMCLAPYIVAVKIGGTA